MFAYWLTFKIGGLVDRRDFLKGVTQSAWVTAAALLLPQPQAGPPAGAEASVGGRRFRGTPQGRILESLDEGRTWRSVAYFGAHCSIAQIFESQGYLYANVRVQGHGFTLRSLDARNWRTIDPITRIV